MLFNGFVNHFQIFLVVFLRILGLFVSAPFYSGGAMPFRFRLGFTFFVTLLATPLIIGGGLQAPADIVQYAVMLLSNFVVGIGIGFFIFTVITAFQVSAQVFSIPMGLGMNEVFDPMSQMQVPAMGNLFGVMVILLLFRVDGQFYMIQVVVDSFGKSALMDGQTIALLKDGLLNSLSLMFEIAIKISLPIIAVTLLLDVAMGLISRVAPQFNVMIMGFNIKILAGFFIIWLMIPVFSNFGSVIIRGILDSARDLAISMKGS